MSYQSRYDKGDWKCICDSCGRIVKGSQLRQRWDGFLVDDRCWEPRQPQDFVRGVADYQAPPFTRPESGTVWPSIVNWFVKATTTLVVYTMRLYYKTVSTTVTCTVTAIQIKYRGEPSVRAVNGSTIDSTTLG